MLDFAYFHVSNYNSEYVVEQLKLCCFYIEDEPINF